METEKKNELNNLEWNLSTMFNSIKDCEGFANNLASDDVRDSICKYKSQDIATAENLKDLMHFYLEESRKIDKAYTYAHLSHDASLSCPEAAKAIETCLNKFHTFSEITSWIDSKIISIPKDLFNSFIENPILSEYKRLLSSIYRMKEHTLSEEQELLYSVLTSPMDGIKSAFTFLSDVEMEFDQAVDSNGVKHPVTKTSYESIIKSHDRSLRKSGFESLYKTFSKHNLSLGSMLLSTIKSHVACSKARKFSCPLEASLKPKEIDVKVYENLIKTVNDNLHISHKLFSVKKRITGISDFSSYDTLSPMNKKTSSKFSFDEAIDIVIKALSPLGDEYTEKLRKGFIAEGWAHVFPKKDKRSGAYSSGCYDSKPYMLLNFTNTLYDLYVIAHEAGHSMHSFYSCKSQPYSSHSYPIFLAEIASTVNEFLLSDYIMKLEDQSMRSEGAQQQIESFQSTLFRQTMFAEFELWAHKNIAENSPLTSEILNNKYISLAKKYFGDDVNVCDEIKYEWSRIPHFYSPFYVYQYATGISIAKCISDKLINKEEGFKEKYLEFLSAGNSKSPRDILINLEIDIHDSKYLIDSLSSINKLLENM